jgi:phenylalanyl-tRNA synthetase beta chain
LCGARPVGGTIDVGGPGPEAAVVPLRAGKLAALLGAAVPLDDAAAILERLGFGLERGDDALAVRVPYWRRRDVTREADLIEEVARIWGLDRLPATLPSRRGAGGRLAPEQRLRRRAEDALVGAGLYEAIGWSFAAPDAVDRLALAPGDPRRAVVPLENPMSEGHAVMRTMLLPSLLEAARRNRSRGIEDVRLFEYGAVYLDRGALGGDGDGAAAAPTGNPWYPRLDPALPVARPQLGALLAGRMRPATWREPDPPRADFFAAKAVIATLADALRVDWSVEPAREPFLHPGRSARVLVGGAAAGWVGELHPGVAASWDLEDAAAFELDWALLGGAAQGVAR